MKRKLLTKGYCVSYFSATVKTSFLSFLFFSSLMMECSFFILLLSAASLRSLSLCSAASDHKEMKKQTNKGTEEAFAANKNHVISNKSIVNRNKKRNRRMSVLTSEFQSTRTAIHSSRHAVLQQRTRTW